MGFFDLWKVKNNVHKKAEEVDCRAVIIPDGLDFQLREIAFLSCVNLIANKIALCTMRQFEKNKEVSGKESWLWNVEPNKTQNAAGFWFKAIYKLYAENEALIIEEPYGSGLVVADSWSIDDTKPTPVYRSITVGNRHVERLSESKVMRLVLHNKNIGPLIKKMNDSFLALMATAQNRYQFENGQHWKVQVNQMITADSEWVEKFQKVIEKQIKPFLSGNNGVLPELDGYKYSQVTSGSYTSQDYRELLKSIWTETAKAFGIPPVLMEGAVADTSKATERLLTEVIDPIARQITQEANRKRYSYEDYVNGDYVFMDTSTILHYDLLANAANVEKLVGAGLWSVNELRKKLGYTEINEEWANRHYLTKNIGTTQQAAEEEDG